MTINLEWGDSASRHNDVLTSGKDWRHFWVSQSEGRGGGGVAAGISGKEPGMLLNVLK